MNIQKAEVKIAITKEFGKQFAEQTEGAKKEQWAVIGEVRALRNAAKKVGELMGGVDQDLKEGKIDKEMAEPHLVARYAKRQYQHVIGVIDNLATQAEITAHRAAGMEIGFRRSAELLEKAYQQELQKLQALQDAIAAGTVQLSDGELMVVDGEGEGGRPLPGGHPGLSLKDQRQMEDEQEKGEVVSLDSKKPKGKAKAKGKALSEGETKGKGDKTIN